MTNEELAELKAWCSSKEEELKHMPALSSAVPGLISALEQEREKNARLIDLNGPWTHGLAKKVYGEGFSKGYDKGIAKMRAKVQVLCEELEEIAAQWCRHGNARRLNPDGSRRALWCCDCSEYIPSPDYNPARQALAKVNDTAPTKDHNPSSTTGDQS